MSLLTIMEEVCGRLGVPKPNAVISNNDAQIILLISLAHSEGAALSAFPWQSLTREAGFTSVATEYQDTIANLAFGFKSLVNGTFWNRTRDREVRISISPSEWQALKSSNTSGILEQARIRQNNLYIFPTPTAGDQYYLEYISRYWIQSAAGNGKPYFSDDTDNILYDEELFICGVVWRFLERNGLEYAEKFNDYQRMKIDLQAMDGGAPVLNMGCKSDFLGVIYPEGDWSV